MRSRNMQIGIVGFGRWGIALYRLFRELRGVEVAAICKRKREIPESVKLGATKLYTDMKEMFEYEKLNAVVIATPPTEHLAATKAAAERGVHVFCEKPMAISVEECDEMIDVCKRSQVKLFIAFKHRYAKAYEYIKKNSVNFGNPLWAFYTYPLWKIPDPGWKFVEDGCRGIVVENVVHAIDNLRYLMGDVARVYAEGDTFIFKGAKPPDSCIFTLRFKNSAIAAIGAGCTSEEIISREYLDIHFEKAVAQVWGFLDYPFNLRIFRRDENCVEEHHFEGSDGVREEIRHFLQCIERNEEPLATGLDGREAVRVALTVIKSLRSHTVLELK